MNSSFLNPFDYLDHVRGIERKTIDEFVENESSHEPDGGYSFVRLGYLYTNKIED